jgi:hypothetical protein
MYSSDTFNWSAAYLQCVWFYIVHDTLATNTAGTNIGGTNTATSPASSNTGFSKSLPSSGTNNTQIAPFVTSSGSIGLLSTGTGQITVATSITVLSQSTGSANAPIDHNSMTPATKIGLGLGVSLGVLVLSFIAVLAWIFFKRKNAREMDDPSLLPPSYEQAAAASSTSSHPIYEVSEQSRVFEADTRRSHYVELQDVKTSALPPQELP